MIYIYGSHNNSKNNQTQINEKNKQNTNKNKPATKTTL